jgi:hypothetical protein
MHAQIPSIQGRLEGLLSSTFPVARMVHVTEGARIASHDTFSVVSLKTLQIELLLMTSKESGWREDVRMRPQWSGHCLVATRHAFVDKIHSSAIAGDTQCLTIMDTLQNCNICNTSRACVVSPHLLELRSG